MMPRTIRPAPLLWAAALSGALAAPAAPPRKPVKSVPHRPRPAASTAVGPLHWEPLHEPGSGGWMVGMRISPHDSGRMLISGDMLGVGLSTDGGRTWVATYGFKSWEMGDLTWHPADPMTVWAGSASGPYVSHDGGVHWSERRAGMPPPQGFGYSAPVEKVLYDPQDAGHLLALGGSSRRWDMHTWDKTALGAVWESRDGGGHWTRLVTLGADGADPAPDARPGVNIVSGGFGAGSSRLIYAGLDGHGVRVSEDGGRTWADRTAGLPHPNVERVIPHPRDPNTVFVSLDNHRRADGTFEPGGVYKSSDAGRHWASISHGLRQNSGPDGNRVARYKGFAVCEADPDAMYVSDWAWDGGVSYVTRDGGAHWRAAVTKGSFGVKDQPAGEGVFRLANSQPAGLGMTVFSVDPRNPQVAYGLGSDSVIGTRDGGRTWADALSDRVRGTYAPSPWRGRGYAGWCATNVRFNPYRVGQSALQMMDAGRVWLSDDGLHSWTRFLNDPAPWGGGDDLCFTPDGHVYATTGQSGSFDGIALSADGGHTWTMRAGAARGEVR